MMNITNSRFAILSALALLVLMSVALAGCGFKPVYSKTDNAQNKSVRSALANTYIDIIPNRDGVLLRNHLIDQFYKNGAPTSPAYVLKVRSIQAKQSNLDLTENADATRSQISLRTEFTLIDKASGKELTKQQVNAITSYNVLQSEFATRVSRQSSKDNAVKELARQIETRLSLYFSY